MINASADLFSELENNGFYSDMKWFNDLNYSKLITLYKLLEDIWNYRAGLTIEDKIRIFPPNGYLFKFPILNLYTLNKLQLQNLIITEILNFNESNDDSDKKLGFMWFLYGLSNVSRDCYLNYNWLIL